MQALQKKKQKEIISNVFSSRIKSGNIHKAKGTTFDNVIGDLTLYRPKAERWFVQIRLLYTMFSRGIYDVWVLKSETGKELGNYGRKE